MAAVLKHCLYTPRAPIRHGIYSQVVVVDRTVYISGQVGMDVTSGLLVEGGVENQAKQALINMEEILKAAGCSYNNVVKVTLLLADINDYMKVTSVYNTFFSRNLPASTAYQVSALPRGGLVEMEAIAVLGPISDS
ncbi:hypothetical protein DPEC_G00289460 [Dallia pectoralis]|uniref:Uncharacterized protein n=1 Tax=Dallia pectoralis TaxID=75939 RepID=A0ACC2FKR1_DALPE|nr:hypothetical protein DPEC_G00289460 [Dallia pectoralis]